MHLEKPLYVPFQFLVKELHCFNETVNILLKILCIWWQGPLDLPSPLASCFTVVLNKNTKNITKTLPWLAIEAANRMNGLGEELLGGDKAGWPDWAGNSKSLARSRRSGTTDLPLGWTQLCWTPNSINNTQIKDQLANKHQTNRNRFANNDIHTYWQIYQSCKKNYHWPQFYVLSSFPTLASFAAAVFGVAIALNKGKGKPTQLDTTVFCRIKL